MSHWIFKKPTYFKAWCIMLLTVNYEKTTVFINGKNIECGRGQSLLSLQSWVEKFGVSEWSIQKVRTFFELLKKDGMIQHENISKTTRLTICNYDSYQNGQQEDNIKVTTNNKYKEIIIKNLGENFVEPVSLWLKYKSEKNQKYKETGFVTFLKKLNKLSDGSPEIAMNIIEESMANNYQGIFPLKGNKSNQNPNQSYR